MTGLGLIGREHPTQVLRRALDTVLSSHGGLVLVTGEPGIGKSALVADLAGQARRDGALVATGACWDGDGAPGYWPWIQVLRDLRDDALGEGPGSPDDMLSCLLGEGGAPPVGRHAEFHFADTVAGLLTTVSRDRPVVVVLEDLHWIDPESLRLLGFVAHHTWHEQVLVIGTYRDVEVDPSPHPAAQTLAALAAKATSVALTGLDRDGVRALMARTVGVEPDDDTADDVLRRTGGNPFFVEQVAAMWADQGAIGPLPSGLRAALERRVSSLPDDVHDLLTVASALGPEFSPDLLAEVDGRSRTDIDPLIAAAVAARVLHTPAPGTLAFTHSLLRDVLYEVAAETEIRRHHAAALRALERTPRLARDPATAELAHHACRAVPDVDPTVAQRHVLTAARDAARRLAFDESIDHYRAALTIEPGEGCAALGDALTGPERATIVLELAATEQRAGAIATARRSYLEVVATARDLDDPRLLAEAVLGIHDLGSSERDLPGDLDLLEEARVRLDADADPDDPPDPLAVRLLAATSRAFWHHSWQSGLPADADEVERLSARALDAARSCGDDGTLGFALLARHDTIWRPSTAPERERLADEMAAVAHRSHDDELRLQAWLLRIVALLEQGDPRSLAEHDAFVAAAERSRLPRWRFAAQSRQATFAMLQGRFDEAEAAADEAYQLGRRLGEVGADHLWLGQRLELALLRGRFHEASRFADEASSQTDDGSSGMLDMALVAVGRGDVEVALRYLDDAGQAVDELAVWAEAWALRLRAQVAAASGDPDRCERTRKALAAVEHRWGVIGAAAAVVGPLGLWAAALDAAQERWDDAIDGFVGVEAAAERLGARPWVVQARLGLARARLGRNGGEGEDLTLALALSDAVVDEASELDMPHLIEQARQVRAGLDTTQPGAAATSTPTNRPAEADRRDGRRAGEFRLDGEVWAVGLDGVTVHVPDAKGLRDLHVLLGQPGAQVPAVKLANPEGGVEAETSRRLGGDPVLDDEARAAYRRRLTQLDEQIEQATARHDDRRGANLDEERQALLDERQRAAGRRGRPPRRGGAGAPPRGAAGPAPAPPPPARPPPPPSRVVPG
jgi:tetratricopeptide (TPR) repeat protein